MRHARGFTLAELMVVIGIMLVLMVATFGVFSVVAEQGGPDNAIAQVQAMMNGARDYAATNGVTTQVYFNVDPTNTADGSSMKLQYLAPDGKTWADVPGRQAVNLHNWMVVCRKMPATLPTAPAVAAGNQPTSQELQAWQSYRANLLQAVQTFAVTPGTPPQVNASVAQLGVVFDPRGYLATNQNPAGTSSQPSDPCYALTVVQLGGGMRVTDYAFFPLNATAGTRIFFE